MNRDERQERISDPVLAAALADLRADVSHDVDWENLRRTINDRAELVFARRRVRRSIFVPRSLIPLAAAASVAFALWMGPGLVSNVVGTNGTTEFATADAEEVLVEALGSDLTEQEFRSLVTGRANPEAWLAFAIGE